MAEIKDTAHSPANSTDSNDQEFVLTAEMMVDAEDYEATIGEEEDMMDDEEDDDDELEDLQKESEMPIEELLAMYYNGTNDENEVNTSQQGGMSSTKEPALSKNEDDSDQSIVESRTGGTEGQDETDPFQNQRITRGLAALNSQYFVEEEYSSDEDYQPGTTAADEWKKEIQIGDNYQAEVCDGISPYLPNEKTKDFEDKLLWTPHVVTSEQLSSYLDLVYKLTELSQQSNRDDEQALFTLLQTKDINAALRKRQEQERQPPDVSLWSEEECQNFEQGLRVFGKDFRLIQKNKVQSRTVGEIVQFYYLWKKTERHDAFVTQTKLGRKKYTLPGIADMMGRFMEENESLFSSRSFSPSSFEFEQNHLQSENEIKKEHVDYNTTHATPINNANNTKENIYNNTTNIYNKNVTTIGGGGVNYQNASKTISRENRINSSTSEESWRSSAVTTSIPIGTTN